MRSPLRWVVVLLVASALLLALRVAARPYVRATSLIVRIAGLEQQHPAVASLETVAVSEQKDEVPSRFGPLRARIYTPDLGARRAVLLTPGVNALGIDEPRLVAFARNLAATGLLVVTPELPDLSHYQITPRSTDMLEDAALWLSGRRDLTRGEPIGVMGISFAGGLSTVAAGRPSLRGRLAFVFSFGGHANFQRVVRYLCSAVEPPAPAGYGLSKTPAPHDYSLAIVTLDLVLAGRLVPAEQADGLKTGVLTFLHASHLALFDRKKAGEEFQSALAQEAALPEPARTYMHLVNTRDVKDLGPKLLPFISDMGDDPALSPDRSPAPDAPVFLIHGAEDNVVPAAETAFLAEHLKSQAAAVRVLITPLISHAEVDRPATRAEIWDLVSFFKAMLST
jgi:dienelactone hydrolase